MPDAGQVVEEIRAEGAAEVGAAAAAGDAVISEQVAEVADDLADHAEVSEERHEEILEGEAWLRERIGSLAALMEALQAQLSSLSQSQSLSLQTIQSSLEGLSQSQSRSLELLEALRPSTLQPQPEAVVVVEPTIEPENTPEKLESQPVPEKPRRRRII